MSIYYILLHSTEQKRLGEKNMLKKAVGTCCHHLDLFTQFALFIAPCKS